MCIPPPPTGSTGSKLERKARAEEMVKVLEGGQEEARRGEKRMKEWRRVEGRGSEGEEKSGKERT